MNTAEARAVLATVLRTTGQPNRSMPSAAASALGDMGDPQYYPLMLQLLDSPDTRVRRAAIDGVGKLGGELGVARLLDVARSGTISDLRGAITELGSVKSRAAVKGIIDLIATVPDSNQWIAEGALFVLTHHRLPPEPTVRTPQQSSAAWQEWWGAGGRDAPVYSPYECPLAPPGGQ